MIFAFSSVWEENIDKTRIRFRTARETMNQHLENLFGTIDVPFNDRPILEVRIPDAVPEAFEKVLNYIYTDRIDCKY